MPSQIIVIRHWEQFQHYHDRSAPWVKLYRDLLTSESWVLGTDLSRLVQVASVLLAVRYSNKTPLNFPLLKRVASFDCTERQFIEAIAHLAKDFLEIQTVPDELNGSEQSASTLLASCTSEERREEGEEIRGEERRSMSNAKRDSTVVELPDAAKRVFQHWQETWKHPKAHLDAKRRRVITQALVGYSADQLCQAISGYLNSPHHCGQNERSTVYDDIETFLRDAKHIDAGIRFHENPPRTDLSALTRKNVAATTDWVPPEIRNAAS